MPFFWVAGSCVTYSNLPAMFLLLFVLFVPTPSSSMASVVPVRSLADFVSRSVCNFSMFWLADTV